MRIGLYGGSFDPIHRGHVAPVLEAAAAHRLDRVIYLPTASPPHKTDRQKAPANRRYAMAELALLEHPHLQVSDAEMMRRPAYTIDTLDLFESRYPDDSLLLILGADSFCQLDTWHQGEAIAARLELIVLSRPGWRLAADELPGPQRQAARAGRVHVVSNVPVEASSTEIRRCVRSGEPVPEAWLAPSVLDYLKKYGLYRRA
ncbi:MAG: nicotinate-nucleotide adenylyltransferase [Acidobacteriota bacterium]